MQILVKTATETIAARTHNRADIEGKFSAFDEYGNLLIISGWLCDVDVIEEDSTKELDFNN